MRRIRRNEIMQAQRFARAAPAFDTNQGGSMNTKTNVEGARLDAARDWLCECSGGLDRATQRTYEQQTPHWIRERIGALYPGNTPGQDGWTSFCEDWSAGTLAPAQRSGARHGIRYVVIGLGSPDEPAMENDVTDAAELLRRQTAFVVTPLSAEASSALTDALLREGALRSEAV